MAFDPNQPFEEVEEVGFDPNLPFELVEEPAGTSVEQEVSQLGAALKSGIAQPLQAMGVTAETLGMPAVGAALKGAVEQPEGYVPAAQRFMEPQAGEAQLGGFAFQYLPRAIVEQVGQLGGSIVSRAAGGIIGGAAGSVVPGAGTAVGAGIGMFTGPALFEAAQIVGPVAQERAKNNNREIPNSEDLAYAWTTAGTSGALNAIGTKYLPGGEKAVGALTKRIAASFLGESATEGAQALAQQAGETILTEKGLEIQPKAALGEALIGGVSAGGATILMSPLQKEQVDIEKEADLESRDLSIPVDDPEARANLDKAAILEQENKDSLAIINKFGVESEEGKSAQQTIVDNTDEITKINEALPAGLSLPITPVEQRQIELAKEIAAPAKKEAKLPAMPSIEEQTAEAAYGRETGVYDVFGAATRRPAKLPKEIERPKMPSIAEQEAGMVYGGETGVYDVFGAVRRKPAPPVTEAPAITPAPVVKPTKEAIITVDKTESFNQELEQKKDFNPPAIPSLQDARSVPDKVAKKGNTLSISGGSQEAIILNNEKAKKKFDEIGYERQEIVLPDDINEKVSERYGQSISNIKSIYSPTWLGAHFHGGIAISKDVKGTQRGRVVAHELGHASHSLLGDQINKDQEVLNELAKIEELLYPGLREKIQSSRNPDTRFFNYLLSADELIAEFNVERITNPEQAAQVAPKLTSLLESVEKDKRLVADRKTFPVILGAIKETKERLKVKGLEPRKVKEGTGDKLTSKVRQWSELSKWILKWGKEGRFKDLRSAKIALSNLRNIYEAPKSFAKRTAELTGNQELIDYVEELYPAPAPQVVEGLQAVSENTATPTQLTELSQSGLVDIVKGQPVINEEGQAVLTQAQAPLPKLTPEERRAEIEAAPAPEVAPVVTASQITPSRTRPKERISFQTPIETPIGKIIAYEWQYKMEEVPDREGELVMRRFSDWDAAEKNAQTGRDIVHQFTVEKPDGTTELVSLESALGQVPVSNKETFKSVIRAARRLPIYEAELASLEKQQKEYNDAANFAFEEGWKNAPEIDIRATGFPEVMQRGARMAWIQNKEYDLIESRDLNAEKTKITNPRIEENIKKNWALSQVRIPRLTESQENRIASLRRSIKKDKAALKSAQITQAKPETVPAAPTKPVPSKLRGEAEAAPTGIAVGSRIKLGKSPQTYTIEEVIPQSATEQELGEQYYSVKNERTGEVQTVEAGDLRQVKGKGARKIAAATRNEEYMRLAQDPEANREQLQRMVDEAAKRAGYNVGPVFHGTNSNTFTEFDSSKGGKGAAGKGFYFSNSQDVAKRYGNRIMRVFLRMNDPVINDERGVLIGGRDTASGDSRWIKGGFPGLREGQQIMLVRDPNQIKSADPVTYDDAGNIIPLEERFQPTSPDIRRQAIDTTPEGILITPPDQQYTFNEVFDVAYDMFGGEIPEGFTIVNDSKDKDFEFKAAYIPESGEIIVNLAYLNRNDDIRDAITHELGHYIYGDPEFRAAFDQFIASLSPEARAELDAYVDTAYNKETGEIRLEEKMVRAFVDQFINEEQAPMWRTMLDAIKRFLNKLGFKFNISDRDAISVFTAALNRYKAGEAFSREGMARKMAAQPAPEKPAGEKPKMERYKGKAQVAGVPGIGAEKDTPKAINKKTESIIRERVFDAAIVSDNQTKKAWNLIQRLEQNNKDAGKNAQAINELTRETMQDVEADEVVKQSIGAVKLRNELYAYAIKLAGEGDPKMLNYLLNTRLSIGSGNIVEGDAGRLLQAMASLKSWIVRATEAEQTGFFTMAAQQFFGTKTPTDEQVQQIKDIFNKVKEVKVDQEKELMGELEEVGKAAGVDLPAVIQKQIESAPGLDPMVVAMTAMQKLYGGTITTQYEPISKRAQGRFEGVKKIIQSGITNYRQKIVSKAANGLETGFWKTLSSTEQKPGPLGELDAAQNKALGNIVKQALIKMGLKGTPPDTKMSIYEQVASILNEQPLSKDKIKMADENIRGGIESKRQTELENAAEDQIDAINLKYDEMTIAWDDAMSRMLDMPVSETMLRRMILNELKESDSSIADLATLMDEEPVIGSSRQDRLVNSIIEKVTGVSFDGQPTRDYTNLKTYLSSLLENMVLAKQQKNKAAKAVAKVRKEAAGDPTKQAQAQIDKLAKIQADPTIFGEKKIDPVRNVVRDALALQLNIGFTPEQTAKIKNNWKGAFVADPNNKGIPTSFMLELQRLGVSEAAANTLADIVWRQIEVNAMNRQMEATNKAVEAGPIGGIVQAILDTPLAMQQDPDWRKKVIVDYLKNGGVKNPERIAELFDVSLRKRFAKAQEEAAIKAAKSIKGGLTPNSKRALEKFLKAIRAQVLDPGKDVAKAFAEEMGWKGFTTEQIVRLNELDAIVNDNEKTDAEKAVATEQIQQIIDKVSMPPQVKEIMASFYIGNALMRFPTFAVQAFDPLAMTTFNTAIESFRNVTNPQQFIQTWANYGRAVSNLFRETAYSFKNDVLRSGRMIDYLENEDRKIKRLWNEAENKWKRGDIRGAMKDGIFGYTAWTFRTLKALDDGAYSLLTSTTLPQYVEAALKNAKIPREKRRGVMRQVLHAREMDIEQMVNKGIPKNDAVIYANERMQAAITKELSGLNIDAQEVINSAINDALARIGKTRFAEDILTGKVEEVKDLGTISAPFLRWYESVSKAVSGKGSESQKIFYRILLGFPLIPARIFNIAAGYTPLTIYRHALKGRYQLTYGTALQRRQRLAEQLAGTMVLLPLLALRSNSLDEEDEKEKGFGIYITGQGPSKLKDKTLHAKWNDRHDPFSLEFRMGGKTKFAIDAKAAGPLSVMIYLLGAMDDWETNRKLDGLKTSKDDWKEAQDKASILTSLYELAGYATLTTARRGPTTGVMQGLVDFRRFPDDPLAAIGADVSFSAMPAVPILGTGIAKNISDFLSQPIDNTTKEGAILSNIPIVGPIAGKPALNSYGQKIGELRVSEKLKKSFGVPFTLVVSDSEEDNKLTSLTLKYGDGPTPLRREDVENELKSAITDDEWYLAAKTFGDRNRSYVLKNYGRYEKLKPAVFSKVMSKLAQASKANAISAVRKARRNNP